MDNKIKMMDYVLHDERISFTAKGIFSFLLLHRLSYTDGPIFGELRKYSCESSKEINDALEELIGRGYVIKTSDIGEYEVNLENIDRTIGFLDDALDDIDER